MPNDEITLAEIKDVEIFGIGTWKGSQKITVTGSMLDQMVTAFHALSDKVSGFRPPIKLGHTDAQRFIGQNNGAPALGWVSAMRRVGDKVLADFSDVPSSLVDLIRKRLYNSVSIELLPKLEYQGTTFENVLSAVAVLGAELPAVKGLKELSLSLFDASVQERIFLSEKEQGQQMADYTQAQLDALIEAAVTKANAAAKATFETQVAAVRTELTGKVTAAETAKTAAETKLKEAETAAANFAAEQAKANVESVVDAAIKAGKLLPKDKAATLAFASSLDATKKIKFGEKEECSAFDHWKAGLMAGTTKVKLTEKTSADNHEQGDKAADIEVSDLANQKIAAAGGSTKLNFADAVTAVLNENPDLKSRYAALS